MTPMLERRDVFAAALAASLAGNAAAAAEFEIKPLGVDPARVAGLSEALIRSHYDNNYAGAVRRLNAITAELARTSAPELPNFLLNGLKREQLVAMNSAILHEIHFAGLGGGGEPEGALAAALERDFGSVAAWRGEFAAMGKALGGGSGWVLLSYLPRMKRLVNVWAADHTMSGAGATPILALDMYEHAYHMDYGAKAGAYVDAYMKAINWPAVAGAYAAARAAG
jgi:Fe-Mn family superoxide dismutase